MYFKFWLEVLLMIAARSLAASAKPFATSTLNSAKASVTSTLNSARAAVNVAPRTVLGGHGVPTAR